MCRDTDHGGRRCPGDSADARRARRYARAAAAATAERDSSVRPEAPDAPVVPERPEVEVLAERAAAVREVLVRQEEINNEMVRYLTRELRDVPTQDRGPLREAKLRELLAEHSLEQFISGPDPLFEGPYGTVNWTRLEREVTELGAATDAWLDFELTEQVSAYEQALREEQEAKARFVERRQQIRELIDSAGPDQATDALHQESRQHHSGTSDLALARDAAQKRRDEAKEAYFARKRELLGQIRPMGGTLAWTDAGVKTPKRVDAEVQRAAAMLPSDWIEANNRVGTQNVDPHQALRPMRVRESTKRAHYNENASFATRHVAPEIYLHTGTFGKHETPEELAEQFTTNPWRKVVPYDQWPPEYTSAYTARDGVLIQSYEVAFPGSVNWETGRKVVAEDGTLNLTGRAASGWERHRYTDTSGEERLCYRRPKMNISVNRKHGYAELTIPKNTPGSSTTLHELTHRCENLNPTIGKLEGSFIMRRTTDENGERHETESYHSHLRDERVRPDSFVDRYIGKDYRSSTYFEVMSMGIEMALHGAHGSFGKLDEPDAWYRRDTSLEALRDDDHHAFVLGTLLSA